MTDLNLNQIELLRKRLNEELPGLKSHLKMAPLINNKPYRGFKPTSDFRSSAVLLTLVPNEYNDLSILFTLRSSNLNKHKGQISFPGGKSEFDETPYMTALREAKEEIGLISTNIDILGILSNLFVPPSNSYITPVVGYIKQVPELKINQDEVEDAFIVSINQLLSSDYKKIETWNFDGYDVEVPLWNVYSKAPLWGATAMILSEFLDIYQELFRH